MTDISPDSKITRLEARVATLEAELVARSRELQQIQKFCCRRDLVLIDRIRAGLPPLSRYTYEADLWQETTDLTAAEVEPVLLDLWRSLTPVEPDDDAS
jgi:hypothetical protein